MTDPIEIMARAIWDGRELAFPPKTRMTWEKGTHAARLATVQHAHNVIAALTEAGCAIVPTAITPEIGDAIMQNVGFPVRAWSAAIEAGRVKP